MSEPTDRPTVGVVVAVRDGAAHLEAALRSVVDQEPPPDDVLVVDGGSTDGSAELAASIPGVRTVAQTGTGLGQARNQGVAEVAGELVAFCDADDRWTEGSLASRVEALRTDPSAAAAVGEVRTVALAGERVPDLRAADLGRRTAGWTPGSVLVRRDAFDRVGPFAEHLRIGTDHDWLARLVQAEAVVRVDEVVLAKGVRAGSLSTEASAYRDELVQVGWDHVRRVRGTTTSTTSTMSTSSAVARQVLHVVPRMLGGGPERGVIAQAAASRAAGLEVRHDAVVLEGPASLPLVLAARRAGLTVEVAPDPERLDALAAAADVVVLHWWNHPGLRSILERGLPPARLVLWCHVLGLHPPQVLAADLAAAVDHVVLTCEESRRSEVARAAAAAGVPVTVLPSTVDLGRLDGFTPRPHAGVAYGYVGLVNDTKLHPGFASLCAAVAEQVQDARFVVAGGGGGEDRLRDRFAELGLADRADVLGPRDDLRTVLEGVDVFVSPLVADTYATAEATLQETMWVGLPPILFRRRGGAWPSVDDGRTGLLADDDEAFVAAMVRLGLDADLRTRLGTAAKEHAHEAFAPEPRRRAAEALLDEVGGSAKRAHPVVPGAGEPAAARFVRTLGQQAGPFAVSLAGAASAAALTTADDAIGASSTLLVLGDGGLTHWRNVAPDDPHLRYWSGLVQAAAGRPEVAAAELADAEALGLTDGRPATRRRAILDG